MEATARRRLNRLSALSRLTKVPLAVATSIIVALGMLPAQSAAATSNILANYVSACPSSGSGSMAPSTYVYAYGVVSFNLRPNTYTCTGYVFTGWVSDIADENGVVNYSDGASASYLFNSDYSIRTRTLTAQWAPQFTVTFNANNGSGAMSPQVIVGTGTLTGNTFTRAGYTFTGWNTAADGTGTSYPDSWTFTPNGSVTLYAQWLPAPSMYLDATNIASYPGSGTTWNDLSGNAHTGTLHGLVNYDAANHALNFAGTTHGTGNVSLNGSFNDFSTGFTTEFEAAFRSHASYSWERIFDFSPALDNHVNGFWVGQFQTSGEVAVEIRDSSGGSAGYCATSTGGTEIVDGQFAKWMVTIDNSSTHQCRIYKNGIEQPTQLWTNINSAPWLATVGAPVATGGVPFLLPATSSRLSNFVGASNWSADNDLNGEIRYVRTFQQALSPATALVASTATVSFSPNATGTTGSMNNQTSTSQTTLTTNGFTRSGYAFAGWNTRADGTGVSYANGATYPFSSSTALYAQWTFVPIITFNANYTGGATTTQQALGSTALNANPFSRDGYSFSGWNTAAAGTGTSYANGASVNLTASVTLYAQWIAWPKVTFMPNGGNGSMAVQSSGNPAPLNPNTFTRSGYVFTGWNTSSGGNGTSYANGDNYNFSTNITLYAQWESNFTGGGYITLNSNYSGGPSAVRQFFYSIFGAPIALNSNAFTRSGYALIGWNTRPDGSGTAYTRDQALNGIGGEGKVLYAQWGVPSTTTFAANYPGGSTTSQVGAGTIALAPNSFARPGYVFLQWNTAANGSGTGYADQASYSFGTDITLYAQWVQQVTVTFNANGGVGTMPQQSTISARNLVANTFTRTGWDFIGWNTAANGSGTSYGNGALFPFGTNTTLYAQWAQRFTVTFNANGGGGTMANQSLSGSGALTSNSFTRSGYVFVGWNTAASGKGTAYSDGATFAFTAPTTLYAQWATAVTVTFCSPQVFAPSYKWGCGKVIGQQSAAKGSTVALTRFPAATACVSQDGCFSYWNTDGGGSGTSYADGGNFTFSANTTLYAISKYALTITYSSNTSWAGRQDSTSTFTAIRLTTVQLASYASQGWASPAGYIFTGWQDWNAGTFYPAGSLYVIPNSNPYDPYYRPVILRAQWAKASTVTFVNGSGYPTSTQVAATGSTQTLNPNPVSRTDCTFTGWKDSGGTAYADGASFKFASDTTLYAQWNCLDYNTAQYNRAAQAAGVNLNELSVTTQVTTVGNQVTLVTTWSYRGINYTSTLTTTTSAAAPIDALVTLAGTTAKSNAVAFILAHSTPTVLGRITPDSNGNAEVITSLPDGLEPGVHRLTMEIPDSDSNGLGVATLAYFAMSQSGVLLGYYQTEGEAQAAYAASLPAHQTWVTVGIFGVVFLGVSAIVVVLWRRRRRTA